MKPEQRRDYVPSFAEPLDGPCEAISIPPDWRSYSPPATEWLQRLLEQRQRVLQTTPTFIRRLEPRLENRSE